MPANTVFGKLKEFLSAYAAAYRARYELGIDDLVPMEFYANNETIIINVAPEEPVDAVSVGEFWYDEDSLRKCTALDMADGFAHTYVKIISDNEIPGTGEVLYSEEFQTTVVHRGEFIDLSIPLDQQPTASIGVKGEILVNDGERYIDFPPGPDGFVLISDPTAEAGVRWAPIHPDTGDITWRGGWLPDLGYQIGDVVRYNDETFVATHHNQDKEPPDEDYWTIFVNRGDQGPPGPPGPVGPQGPSGLKWEGIYIQGAEYLEGDTVSYNGSSFRANKDTSSTPPSDDWDMIAGGAGDSIVRSFICAENISANRVLASNDMGQVMYADATNPDHRNRVIGISKQAGIVGDSIQVVLSGYMYGDPPSPPQPGDSIWNWINGIPLFLADSGLITQDASLPPNKAFSLQIGVAVSAEEMKVSIGYPIIQF